MYLKWIETEYCELIRTKHIIAVSAERGFDNDYLIQCICVDGSKLIIKRYPDGKKYIDSRTGHEEKIIDNKTAAETDYNYIVCLMVARIPDGEITYMITPEDLCREVEENEKP